MNCKQCGGQYCISVVPIFETLSEVQKQEVSQMITNRSFKKGELIFLAGDVNGNLYVVKTGRVKITQLSENGREQVVRILDVGDFFGEFSLFLNRPLASNAKALEDTEICMLKGSAFQAFLMRTPEVMLAMMRQMSERLENVERLLGDVTGKDVGQRIAAYILQNVSVDSDYTFLCPLNKSDMASMLGTTRETLGRKLSLFQQQNYIRMSGRKIIVCNYEKLKAYVQ